MKTVMKKEYISPEAIAIKIQTTGMLAVSVEGFNSNIVAEEPTPITDPGQILGREFDMEETNEFEDFEEYDY